MPTSVKDQITEDTPLPGRVRSIVEDPRRLEVLQTTIPKTFDADKDLASLVELAANHFSAPIALLSLVDENEQWFRCRTGDVGESTPVSQSFCAHAIAQSDNDTLVIPDAQADERFRQNPLVTGEPHIRYYAGCVITLSGQKVGTLCVIDTKPRQKTDESDIETLRSLAGLASSFFKLKYNSTRNLSVEKLVKKQNARLVLAGEAAGLSSWAWDIQNDNLECDTLMRKRLSLPNKKQLSMDDLKSSMPKEDAAEFEEQLMESLKHDDDFIFEFQTPKTGKWILVRGRLLETDAQHRPAVFLGVNLDITKSKTASENTRLLLKELNHRVKNTLAILQSVAAQTLRRSGSKEEFTAAFSGRLQSISAAHTLLSNNEWEDIDLRSLLHSQLSAYMDTDSKIEISNENIILTADQALGLGLILHELCTNAVKHGALSNETGKVILSARTVERNGQNMLHLKWKEVDGPVVDEPEKTGFGSILINRSLDKVLGSSVDLKYEKSGVVADITMPV